MAMGGGSRGECVGSDTSQLARNIKKKIFFFKYKNNKNRDTTVSDRFSNTCMTHNYKNRNNLGLRS